MNHLLVISIRHCIFLQSGSHESKMFLDLTHCNVFESEMGNGQINYLVNLTELICLYVDLELEIKSTYLLFQDHKDKSQERKIVIQIYQKKKKNLYQFFPLWNFRGILPLF